MLDGDIYVGEFQRIVRLLAKGSNHKAVLVSTIGRPDLDAPTCWNTFGDKQPTSLNAP